MQILFDYTYLNYIQNIRNRCNFNLNLNEDNVTCFLISPDKLFHNSTPLCRITFEVIWILQKVTCNLSVCRVAILCIVFVLVNILFNISGSIPVLNLYIITNTHCFYIALQFRKFNIVNNNIIVAPMRIFSIANRCVMHQYTAGDNDRCARLWRLS